MSMKRKGPSPVWTAISLGVLVWEAAPSSRTTVGVMENNTVQYNTIQYNIYNIYNIYNRTILLLTVEK